MRLARGRNSLYLWALVGAVALVLLVWGLNRILGSMTPTDTGGNMLPAAQPTATPPANADWAMYMYDPSRSGFNAGEKKLSPDNAKNLKLLWKRQLGGALAAQPIVYSNTVYIGAWDGIMYALNTADGSVKWKKDTGKTASKLCFPPEAGITSAPAATASGLYFGGGDDKFYALNPGTGDTLWTFDIGDNSEAGGAYNWVSPFLYNGNVYYGIASLCDRPFVPGKLWTLDAVSGKVSGEVSFLPPGQLGGGLWTSPAIDEATGDVYVTTASADFYIPHAYSMARLDPKTLEVVDAWQIPMEVQVYDGDWGTTPTLFRDKNGRLMVGAAAKNGYFYAFDAHSIQPGPVWSVQIADGGSCPQCGEGVLSSSAFAYGTLYVAGGYISLGQVQKFAGTLSALDPTTGAIKWKHPTSSWVIPPVTVANGLVAVGAEETVEVVHAATGEMLWDYAVGSPIYGAPTIADGVLYVPATDGTLYAFGAGDYPESPEAYKVGAVGSNPPGFTPFRTLVPAERLPGDEQCFENKLCVHGAFLDYWKTNGGLERFGPPATAELREGGRTVQYFRNAAFQLQPKPDGSGDTVSLMKLDFRLFYYTPTDTHFDRAEAQPGATFVPETGHNLTEPFLSYWRSHGDVASLGYPVSEPMDEFDTLTLETHRVQYFERSRLEIVKAADGKEAVQIGALGLQVYKQKYGKLP